MKICYVANSRFPSERAHMTQIVHMCNAFVQNGHDVTLLITDRKTNITETPEQFFGVTLLFSVIRIMVPDIAGNAYRIPVFLRPISFILQRFVFAYRSARYIQKQSFDFVYGRDEWVLWFLSFIIPNTLFWESHEARYSLATRLLLKKKNPLIVISEGIRDFYIRHGVDVKNIHVAHDAVDDRFFEPLSSSESAREKLAIKTVKPVIMYIGGLEQGKGASVLFDATKGQDFFETYIMGGKDSEISTLKEGNPSVHFLGSFPYRDLPFHQQAADILIIPNVATDKVSSEYTSPLKLFTYMTSKKPIIASRVPSITNILTEEEAYFFVPDDAQSLQDTIQKVINEPDSRSEKAERAYQKSKTYTWKNRASDIIQFITV